jgi:hypothetical protein
MELILYRHFCLNKYLILETLKKYFQFHNKPDEQSF